MSKKMATSSTATKEGTTNKQGATVTYKYTNEQGDTMTLDEEENDYYQAVLKLKAQEEKEKARKERALEKEKRRFYGGKGFAYETTAETQGDTTTTVTKKLNPYSKKEVARLTTSTITQTQPAPSAAVSGSISGVYDPYTKNERALLKSGFVSEKYKEQIRKDVARREDLAAQRQVFVTSDITPQESSLLQAAWVSSKKKAEILAQRGVSYQGPTTEEEAIPVERPKGMISAAPKTTLWQDVKGWTETLLARGLSAGRPKRADTLEEFGATDSTPGQTVFTGLENMNAEVRPFTKKTLPKTGLGDTSWIDQEVTQSRERQDYFKQRKEDLADDFSFTSKLRRGAASYFTASENFGQFTLNMRKGLAEDVKENPVTYGVIFLSGWAAGVLLGSVGASLYGVSKAAGVTYNAALIGVGGYTSYTYGYSVGKRLAAEPNKDVRAQLIGSEIGRTGAFALGAAGTGPSSESRAARYARQADILNAKSKTYIKPSYGLKVQKSAIPSDVVTEMGDMGTTIKKDAFMSQFYRQEIPTQGPATFSNRYTKGVNIRGWQYSTTHLKNGAIIQSRISPAGVRDIIVLKPGFSSYAGSPKKGIKWLDLGGGANSYKGADVVMDISPKWGLVTRGNAPFLNKVKLIPKKYIQGNFNKGIPLETGSVGKITSKGSLDAFGKRRAYNEAFRVLRERGNISIDTGSARNMPKISRRLRYAGFQDITVEKIPLYHEGKIFDYKYIMTATKPGAMGVTSPKSNTIPGDLKVVGRYSDKISPDIRFTEFVQQSSQAKVMRGKDFRLEVQDNLLTSEGVSMVKQPRFSSYLQPKGTGGLSFKTTIKTQTRAPKATIIQEPGSIRVIEEQVGYKYVDFLPKTPDYRIKLESDSLNNMRVDRIIKERPVVSETQQRSILAGGGFEISYQKRMGYATENLVRTYEKMFRSRKAFVTGQVTRQEPIQEVFRAPTKTDSLIGFQFYAPTGGLKARSPLQVSPLLLSQESVAEPKNMLKTQSLLKVQQISLSRALTQQRTEQRQEARQENLLRSITTQMSITQQKQISLSKQVSLHESITKLSEPPRIKIPGNPIITALPPALPPLRLDSKKSSGILESKFGGKRTSKYQPSVMAISLGIKGSKNLTGELTGIGLRPIVGGGRKRTKRQSKRK